MIPGKWVNAWVNGTPGSIVFGDSCPRGLVKIPPGWLAQIEGATPPKTVMAKTVKNNVFGTCIIDNSNRV